MKVNALIFEWLHIYDDTISDILLRYHHHFRLFLLDGMGVRYNR